MWMTSELYPTERLSRKVVRNAYSVHIDCITLGRTTMSSTCSLCSVIENVDAVSWNEMTHEVTTVLLEFHIFTGDVIVFGWNDEQSNPGISIFRNFAEYWMIDFLSSVGR